METILITGGAGFMGSEVVRKALDHNMRVIVYDNFSYGKTEFLPSDDRLTVIEGDINNTKYFRKTVSTYSPDYVCHLAAIHFIPDCNTNPTKTLRVNTTGTESVLNACKGSNIDKILVASTAAVYPVNDLPNIENQKKVEPIDIYGLSKMFAELLAEKFARETGVVTIALRIFNAVGPRETNPHVIPHIFESAKKSDIIPLGNTAPKRDYIHTSDIAEAIFAICQSDIKGYEIFNIGSGTEYSVEEVVEMLCKILNRKFIIQQEKDLVREVERMHLVANISKIKKAIGWEPKIDLHCALRDTAKYYRLL